MIGMDTTKFVSWPRMSSDHRTIGEGSIYTPRRSSYQRQESFDSEPTAFACLGRCEPFRTVSSLVL